jgi:hypothetical protein
MKTIKIIILTIAILAHQNNFTEDKKNNSHEKSSQPSSSSVSPKNKPELTAHSISEAFQDAIKKINKALEAKNLTSEIKPYLEKAKKILEESL